MGAQSPMPIFTKHRKTLLNIVKHHGTLVKHCETSQNTRTLTIRCDDIGDCGVGITPQMCNRVTNHEDMGTFSKPDRMVTDSLTMHDLTFLKSYFIV